VRLQNFLHSGTAQTGNLAAFLGSQRFRIKWQTILLRCMGYDKRNTEAALV
jgi:hypothetical protein